MPSLDVRLRRLERAAAAGFGMLLALLLMGQVLPKARAVDSESFVLRDATGTVRAVLGMQDGGTVALTLKAANGDDRLALLVRPDGSSMVRALDRTGRAGVEIGSRADGTGVTVLDRGGRTRAALAVAGDGRASVALGESSTKDRVRLSLGADGTGGLYLLDPAGTARVTVATRGDGTPSATLTGDAATISVQGTGDRTGATLSPSSLAIGEGPGRPRIAIDGDDTPSLVMSDVAGRHRATLDVAVDGTTRLDLSDPSGRSRAALMVTGGGSPVILLSDDAGKPTFQVPGER